MSGRSTQGLSLIQLSRKEKLKKNSSSSSSRPRENGDLLSCQSVPIRLPLNPHSKLPPSLSDKKSNGMIHLRVRKLRENRLNGRKKSKEKSLWHNLKKNQRLKLLQHASLNLSGKSRKIVKETDHRSSYQTLALKNHLNHRISQKLRRLQLIQVQRRRLLHHHLSLQRVVKK